MREIFSILLRKIKPLGQRTLPFFLVFRQLQQVRSAQNSRYFSKWRDNWLELQQFAFISDDGVEKGLVRHAEPAHAALQRYGCGGGGFHFIKQTQT